MGNKCLVHVVLLGVGCLGWNNFLCKLHAWEAPYALAGFHLSEGLTETCAARLLPMRMVSSLACWAWCAQVMAEGPKACMGHGLMALLSIHLVPARV